MKIQNLFALLITLTIAFFSCTGPEQKVDVHAQAKAEIKEKGFIVSSVLGSQNLLIETDTFTGVILLDQENEQEDSTVYLASVKEVLLAEEILLSICSLQL